jgi:transposase
MAPEVIVIGVLCAIIASLVIIWLQSCEKVRGLKNDKKALKAEISELNKKAKKQAENYAAALQTLRDYYNEEVERQKKQIECFHSGRIEKLKALIEAYEQANESGRTLINFDEVDPDGPAKNK